jgi:hypothetical protein
LNREGAKDAKKKGERKKQHFPSSFPSSRPSRLRGSNFFAPELTLIAGSGMLCG